MAPSIILDYSEEKKYSGEMMGKTHKFSKGYSSGFVSDYRHAVVETVAESEGFGSSGRVDTEMTASEDSCALPKRKCISLNVDSSDRFGRPTQCFSLSKMSRSEKVELKIRLQAELDQVQAFQRKISMQVSNVVAVSSSSDIRSCSDGQKRPPFDTFNRFSEYSSGPTKKSMPLGRNGPSIKRAQSGRAEVKLVAPVNMPFAHLLKQCEALLKRMKAHQYAWAFLEPVDVVKLNIPDYLTVIKHPMDFSTIQKKLDSGQYSSPREFLADVRLTFSNAMTYNPSGNKYHIMAANLSKFFEQRWKPIEKKLSAIEPPFVPPKLDISRESETLRQTLPSKKRKIFPADYEIKTQPVKTQPDKSRPVKRIMTDGEKIKLSKDIESLDLSVPEHIVNLLRGDCSGDADVDELEIDFETLSDDTLFEVRKLLDEFMLEKQANNAKDERCEMEILNESGLSNSSMQPYKGNDPAEEDVDIGGNDPPISSYPPVEIEKDAAHRMSKCSSSSSSSSDSGSSSSDSDTGSSSGSDSDGDKTSSPARKPRENMAVVAPQARNHGGPQDGNQSVSGLDQLEQSFQPKPANIEADSRQEGESAPPEKVMRAAFMKRKFLDTIQKAREKTLDKGEKGNPEKLRREREELERKHREEKARLEAEVKAAEDAQRQLEEEAAAEAKRKRELEREAARLALQQMEKTVEINENCHFLEDLEMLRSTVAPCLQSVDETSPYHSPDGMGGFKLQGTNPLEQLGLFMKVDDEEEEEGEPTNVPEPAIDVEEGEID